MLYVGLDLSRKRLDWQALDRDGQRVGIGAVPPDRDGLSKLARGLGDAPVLGVIESMSGARFVHDRLELHGWDVRIADAAKARGIAPLACKTDTIDTWVLAELARLELVPEIWLPDPEVRAERERARFRLHLVKHRSALKNRIHAILFQHGVPGSGSDLFGVGGRAMLERLQLPEPWASTVAASLELIDLLDERISSCESELRALGAEHRYIPLLMTCPGIGWVLAFTIASEIGEIDRFASPRKLVGYTGLCPRVEQSGERDRRGPLRKNGPNYLRWALVEAAHSAARHPAYSPVRVRMRARHGPKRGTKIAAIEIGRRLSEAIWHMLTTNQPFAPAGARASLAA
ncbi:MAG: IS110 family transposase [Actinomycetota bacterium]|nr:IS110 family transposase [Actinomycetota bacterium]